MLIINRFNGIKSSQDVYLLANGTYIISTQFTIIDHGKDKGHPYSDEKTFPPLFKEPMRGVTVSRRYDNKSRRHGGHSASLYNPKELEITRLLYTASAIIRDNSMFPVNGINGAGMRWKSSGEVPTSND